MMQNTPNSFQKKEKYAQKDDLFSNRPGRRGKENEEDFPLTAFELLIKRAFQILNKLFVVAKYQFFKRTQHANFNMRWKLPFNMNWFQLAFLAFAKPRRL